MARYLLGEAGAKWLRAAMSQKAPAAAVGATRHVPSSRGDPDGYLHPFALQYAASSGAAGEGEGPSGAWIIWVPDGSLVIDGEAVDLAGSLTAADGYPAVWYDITDVFGGDDPDDEWSLYLDASKDDPKFVIDPEDAENPVLIAQVSGKTVKGVVESALVIGGGGLYPWKVKLFDVTSGNSTSKHVGVWIPQHAAVQVHENVWDGAWYVGKFYGGSDSYSGNVLTDATAAESASGVWADAGTWDGTSTKYVTVQIDTGTGSTPSIRIWNLALVSSAPSSSWGSSGATLHFYLDNLIVAKVVEGGINQYMIGAQVIQHHNGGVVAGGHCGENDDINTGGSGGIFSWTSDTRTIGSGGCMVGRQWYTCTNGTGSGKADGLYQLRVTISTSGGVSLAVVSDALLGADPTSTQCWIPIYQITNGKIAVDYRGAFVVPAYE